MAHKLYHFPHLGFCADHVAAVVAPANLEVSCHESRGKYGFIIWDKWRGCKSARWRRGAVIVSSCVSHILPSCRNPCPDTEQACHRLYWSQHRRQRQRPNQNSANTAANLSTAQGAGKLPKHVYVLSIGETRWPEKVSAIVV